MKKLAFGFLALALAMGALLAVLPGQQVMADPGDVYVATTGDDLTGDGTAGNPYQTIDKGIDEAIAGDTVHVAAGTYVENITMKGGVVIQGAGADVTSINGTRAGSVVTSIGLDATAKLAGFTITNGSAFTGGGMYNENSSP
ncbi:MAG: DUF1565 domain-containing protein, partial [Chloroflexota bacterium]|nr:DUF1565 domain-containing protein [Chloroflexota bacterium]